MPLRFPSVAGMFYPADEAECRRQVEDCVRESATLPKLPPIRGGVVPHAGWIFSGYTAGRLYAALAAQEPPQTVVLFGAVHSWGVRGASLYGEGRWRTPLGDISIDDALAQAVLQEGRGLVVNRPEAHATEHSIEVQVPFVQYLFPEASILPISMPPLPEAQRVGRAVARAVKALGRKAVAIGSSDLTHYGPRFGLTPAGVGQRGLEWLRQNDARLLDLVVQMRAEEIVPEAERRLNACGAGAIAAAIAYAAEIGATRGVLLHYTNSYEVMPSSPPTDIVGYGAVALV